MKTIDEKEKKLKEILNELKNLEIIKPKHLEKLEILEKQKNQLEIEKTELQKKYNSLEQINENLKKYLYKIVTTSAIPIGIPGCPELAF